MNFIIVGAGLFGSMTATALERQGHEVTVVDDAPEDSCSMAAGCLIKPSWLGRLSSEKRAAGLAFINEVYGMRELSFLTHAGTHLNISHLAPSQVLRDRADILIDRVTEVGDGFVATAQNGVLRGTVVVAAGTGCNDLLPGCEVRGLAGVSLMFAGEVEQPRLKVWAPYKQAVCFGDGYGNTWFGDGTAIKAENWDQSRVEKSIERAATYFGLHNPTHVRYGARPYVDNPDGLLWKYGNFTWVNTGGAKSGAVLAGAHASMIADHYAMEALLG
jgi:hypothetical protein